MTKTRIAGDAAISMYVPPDAGQGRGNQGAEIIKEKTGTAVNSFIRDIINVY